MANSIKVIPMSIHFISWSLDVEEAWQYVNKHPEKNIQLNRKFIFVLFLFLFKTMKLSIVP